MGQQVKAKCKCGLQTTILVGGGMLSFMTVEHFPFYCGHCNSVVQANLKDPTPTCHNCNLEAIVPYTNPELLKKPGKKVVASSFENELTNGFYKCPKCEEFSLEFENTGLMWD